MKPEAQKIIDELLEDKSLAQKKQLCEDLNMPFSWPSVKQQINGKGKLMPHKRGRAKYEREMFVIPSVELENGLHIAGFVCHPKVAIHAAYELLRLAKEYGWPEKDQKVLQDEQK